MTIPTFILKNALRNKRRAILSISSVAASLFLLVTLQVALRELTLPPESAGAELRVAVRNRISLTNPLPVRQRRRHHPLHLVWRQIQKRRRHDLCPVCH